MPAVAKPKIAARRAAPYPKLHRALLQLAATRDGFERLCAAAVDQLSGGLVRLMASGDQHGVDGVSTDASPGPRRAVQSKRYRASTPLKLGGLISEMDQASDAYEGLETWILGTTRTLLGKEQEALARHAEQLGWSFVAMDWSQRDGVPLLAAACAAVHSEAAVLLADSEALVELEALHASGAWRPAAEELAQQLQSARVGFETAQAAAAEKLRALYSDSAAARRIAGPSPAFLAAAPPVARETVRAGAVGWWRDGEAALVLLGREGMGKTWAGLDVLRSLAEAEDGPLPVIISAETAQRTPNALEAVVSALRELSDTTSQRLRNPDLYWRRKLRLWRSGDCTPRLIVLVDGLDEALAVRWAGYLAPLLENQWNGLFRLVLTCREDEWSREVGLADSPVVTPRVLPIPRFTETERDAYLRERGVEPTDLSDGVQAAALHPRTAFHVARLAQEAPHLKGLTREQLLLRDYQNTRLVKDGRALHEDEFERLVSDMARAAQQAALEQRAFDVGAGDVARRAVEIAGPDRGSMRQVLSDLVGGQWFRRDARDTTRLVFDDAALPGAVGMALAARVRNLSAEDAKGEIKRFLEPWGADDIGEKVLRTCSAALVTDRACSDDLCKVPLDAWRERPLREAAAVDFWRRLHIFRPALFLEICLRHGGESADWLLEYGVAAFWEDHPDWRAYVEAEVFTWASTIVLPREVTNSSHRRWSNRQRRRQLARLALLRRRGLANAWVWRIGQEAGDRHRQPPGVALRVMSQLPRKPFLAALVGWATSAAMAQGYDYRDAVRWLLRVNFDDPEAAGPAVSEAAEALAQLGDWVSRTAAAILLEALGEPTAEARAHELAPDLSDGPAITEADLRAQTFEQLNAELQSGDGPSTLPKLLFRLSPIAPDFEATLPLEIEADLSRRLAETDESDMRRMVDLQDQGLDCALRWQPNAAAAAVARLALPMLAAGRATDHRQPAQGAFPLLDLSTRAEAADQMRRLDQSDEAEPDREKLAGAAATALEIAGRPFGEQVALLLGAASWPTRYECLLSAPQPGDVERLLAEVDLSAPADVLRPRLAILHQVFERFDVGSVVDPFDWKHVFRREEPKVRTLALTLASHLSSRKAADVLKAMGWSANGLEDQPTRVLGSDILTKLDAGDVLARLPTLDTQVLAHLAAGKGELAHAACDLWFDRIHAELLQVGGGWTWGGERWCYRDKPASYSALVARHGAAAETLIRRVWSAPETRRRITHDSHALGAAWPLLTALAPCCPELVISIWRAVVRSKGGPRPREVERIAMRLPPGEPFDRLRRDLLDDARDDADLLGHVRDLEGEGRRPLVFQVIGEDLAHPQPARRARGLTLAGFLTPSTEACALWTETLAVPPPVGWLRSVYFEAKAWFERGRQMRHWADVALNSESTAKAFAAYRILVAVADDRLWLSWNRAAPDPLPDHERLQWLNFFADNLSTACAARRESLAKTRFHTRTYRDTLRQPAFPGAFA